MGSQLGFVQRPDCPVCQTRPAGVIANLRFDAPPLSDYLWAFYEGRLDPIVMAGAEYRLLRCGYCALMWQEFVLDAPSMEFLYDSVAVGTGDGIRSLKSRQARVSYSIQIEMALNSILPERGTPKFLDYGAGWGHWLDMALAFGCETYSCELSDKRSASHEDRHRRISATDIAADQFDFINAEQVFEHLSDPRGVFDQLAGALRLGGLLRISVPDGEPVLQRIARADWLAPKGSSRSLNAVAPLEHIQAYSRDSLRALGSADSNVKEFRYPLRHHLARHQRLSVMLAALRHPRRLPRPGLILLQRVR